MSQGSFDLGQSDLLVIPAGADYEVTGDGPATQLVVYGKDQFQVAKGYPVREEVGKVAASPLLLHPSAAADSVEEGVSGGAHFELVENQDIMIETTFRSDDQKIYHRGFQQDEVHFQLSGIRATRTTQGEFSLEPGDALLIPLGVSHRNVGNMATIRIVLYTRDTLHVTDAYNARAACRGSGRLNSVAWARTKER